MKVLFRLGRPLPSTILGPVKRCHRALSTNASKDVPRRGSRTLAAAIAAAAITGYGIFHFGASTSEIPPALLSEGRLPTVRYATLAQMEKVTIH